MANITIQSGTIVQRDDGHLVTLRGSVYTEAERQADGGYLYSVGGRKYYASAGTCVVRAEATNYAYHHKDGLVWMV